MVENYISRETLLNDVDDLLPNGILTLMMDLRLTVYPDESIRDRIFDHIKDLNVDTSGLLLDSPLGKRLAEESSFFRAILESGMIEKRTKLMSFHSDEIFDFGSIVELVMGAKVMKFHSVHEILKMYILADKYDIPLARETSVCFIKLYSAVHGIDPFLNWLNRFHDKFLKDLLLKEIMLISKMNFTDDIDKTNIDISMKFPVYGNLWVYTCPENRTDEMYRTLNFKNVINHENKTADNENNLKSYKSEEYDFYK